MKLKCTKSGEIFKVNHVAATDDSGVTWEFFSDYELITDDDPKQTPATCQHTETQIAELTNTVASIAKAMSALLVSSAKNNIRIETLESENQRLKDRLNAIEGLGIPR